MFSRITSFEMYRNLSYKITVDACSSAIVESSVPVRVTASSRSTPLINPLLNNKLRKLLIKFVILMTIVGLPHVEFQQFWGIFS